MYTTLLGGVSSEEKNEKDALWLTSLMVASVATAWFTRSWLQWFEGWSAACIGMLQLPIGAGFTILVYGIQDYFIFGQMSFGLIIGFFFLLIFSPWILLYGMGYGWTMS